MRNFSFFQTISQTIVWVLFRRLTVNNQDNFSDVSPWSIALLCRDFRGEYSGHCVGSLTLD